MSPEKGTRYTIEGRYFNVQGWGVAIVASVVHELEWAAYIGTTWGPVSEQQTIDYVARHGCKLVEKDGRHFFPELNDLAYRR